MSDTIKPVAWIKDTSLISLKRDETTVLAYPYDYLIRPAVPLYTADAIESLQAECERLRAELAAAQKDAEKWKRYVPYPTCIHCHQPTMHTGNVCFSCNQARENRDE